MTMKYSRLETSLSRRFAVCRQKTQHFHSR